MSGGTVIKSTKGLDHPKIEPELTFPKSESSLAPQIYDFSNDEEKQAYVLANAPRVLSALIIRRECTKPAELISKAIDAVSSIYDRVKKPTNCAEH